MAIHRLSVLWYTAPTKYRFPHNCLFGAFLIFKTDYSMRILTNDYVMNLPGSTIPVKGGPQRFARDFATFAVAEGHQWIGLVNHSKDHEQAIGLDTKAPRKEFFFIESEVSSYEAFRDYKATTPLHGLFSGERDKIEKIIEEAHPDIILINGHSVFTWVFATAAFNKNIPVVLEYAGIWKKEIDIYSDLFTSESRVACEAMEREMSERSVANVFLNRSSLRAFTDTVPGAIVTNPKVITLPHAGWTFATEFAPEAHEERVISAVARWDRIKNHEAILAFAEEIVRQKLPWKVRVVTTIPETPKLAEFKERYRELIEVVASMERESLREFYREADALMLPSHFETVGGVVMEALAEGKPTLISPNVGWIDEYEKTGMQDWIVDFSDSKEAVDRLKAQFTRTSWPELGAFAAHVQSEHDPRTIYASYIALFEEISATHVRH